MEPFKDINLDYSIDIVQMLTTYSCWSRRVGLPHHFNLQSTGAVTPGVTAPVGLDCRLK